MKDNRKVKVAWCKCGRSIKLASVLQHAETNKEAQKEFASFAKDGCKIQIMTLDMFKTKPFMTCGH